MVRKPSSIRIDEAEYQAVKTEKFAGWSDRSLAVAHALLVAGKGAKDVAAEHEMTTAQANVLRTRYMDAVRDFRIAQFSATNPALLPGYREDIQKLTAQGFGLDDIVKYLAQYGVTVTTGQLTKYMEK